MLSIAPLFSSRDFWADFPAYNERKFSPAYDFNEENDFYSLSVDLPGLKKEDISLELIESKLTISGKRKRAGEEFSFQRKFVLPELVDTEKIEAQYQDGVLQLKLAKQAASQPRKIEIKG